MITKSVRFVGGKQDQFGMPTPFCNYFCVASEDASDKTATATAIPISTDAVPLNPSHVYLFGKEQDAMDELLVRLRALPTNRGLREV
jgi:hypothetical protein